MGVIQQLLTSYGASAAPVGNDWWVNNCTFSTSPVQRQMYTGEQGVTGNALLIGSMGTGYTTTLRSDDGMTYGTARTFTTSGYTYSYGEFPVMTSDSSLYVGVRARDATKTRTVINKHALDGTLTWTRYIDVAEISQNRPPCFAVDSVGAVYSFVQPSFNISTGFGAVLKMNSSGTHQWAKHCSSVPSSYTNKSIKLGLSDHIHTVFPSTIFSGPPPAYTGFSVAKYNSDGTWVWGTQHGFIDRAPLDTYQLNGIGGYGLDVDLSSEDVYILASGVTTLTSARFLCLMKINSSGVLQWSKQVRHSSGSTTSFAGDVVVVSDGVVFFAEFDSVSFLCKTDFSGTMVATVEVHPGIATFHSYLAQLVKDGNGNLVLSYLGSDYIGVLPYIMTSFTSKFPDDLSKVGTWTIDGSIDFTMSTSTSIVVDAGAPDTLVEVALSLGSFAYEMYDGAGMFTESAATITTTVTDIP